MGRGRRDDRPGGRRSLMAATVLALAPIVSGCGPTACPAIGYLDTLTVHVRGAGTETLDVEVCDGEVCLPRDQGSDGAADVFGGVVRAERTGATWTFTGTFPARFEIRAFTADGVDVAHREARPDWRRVGGTAECGGPRAARIDLTV